MGTPAPLRVWESHFTLYRTIWWSNVLATFVQPLLYMLGMGLGVGAMVDRGGGADVLGGLTYFAYLAPALLATGAMMTAASESLWPVLGGFKWFQNFVAQAATPLTAGQIVAGLGLWHATKAGIGVCGVATVLAMFDSTRTLGLVWAAAAAVLTSLAFAGPITWFTATRESDHSFPMVMRFVITPLFLFGGAFYPIEQLPGWMQPVASMTPLWHGVQLCRGAVHGTLTTRAVALHVGVLVAFAVVGYWGARYAFEKRLAR